MQLRLSLAQQTVWQTAERLRTTNSLPPKKLTPFYKQRVALMHKQRVA